jgi:hypothetical protein
VNKLDYQMNRLFVMADRTLEILAQFSRPFLVRLAINDRQLGWPEHFLKDASLYTCDYIALFDQGAV